ncbi:GNAT family N-acetyltransferase [Massilia sp. H6]|uniref:GNAT family N-acetyltransferase n=1 Tax=Massilia sp. H6 TaxID=2970464 RepID=UPI00216A8679|nr:GNAT family N-acetyltransferase [Massilia sp. H6]UVW28688.1 GNAT family N-acetyltransferase [Massilia sp. H6]
MSIAIRVAVPADLPALFAYLGEQLAENGRDGAPLFQAMERTDAGVPPAMRERFASGMATLPGQPLWRQVWIALDELGTIAGHVDLRGRTEPAARHRTLLGMGVRHDARRAGVGTQLVQTALAWARSTGFDWVDLEVLSQNQQARALYARTGFRVTGEVADLYRIGGVQIGAVQMSFRLA